MTYLYLNLIIYSTKYYFIQHEMLYHSFYFIESGPFVSSFHHYQVSNFFSHFSIFSFFEPQGGDLPRALDLCFRAGELQKKVPQGGSKVRYLY